MRKKRNERSTQHSLKFVFLHAELADLDHKIMESPPHNFPSLLLAVSSRLTKRKDRFVEGQHGATCSLAVIPGGWDVFRQCVSNEQVISSIQYLLCPKGVMAQAGVTCNCRGGKYIGDIYKVQQKYCVTSTLLILRCAVAFVQFAPVYIPRTKPIFSPTIVGPTGQSFLFQ